MIGKNVKGGGFRGLLEYVFAHRDHENRVRDSVDMVAGTVPGMTPRELAAGFRDLRQMRPDLERAVHHGMLRWTEEDAPNLAQQGQMAERWARGMGFEDYVAVSHGDHLHVVASRIRRDGSVVSDSWDWKRSETLVRGLEKEFGLVQVEGSHLTDDSPEGIQGKPRRKAPTAAELALAAKGEPSRRLQLQELVDAAMKGGPDFGTFAGRLQVVGVEVLPNVATTGRVSGLSFVLDGHAMKGSDLGKGYTWNSLQKRGLDYEQGRDSEAISECRDRAKGALDREAHGTDEIRQPVGGGAGGGRPSAGEGSGEPVGRDEEHPRPDRQEVSPDDRRHSETDGVQRLRVGEDRRHDQEAGRGRERFGEQSTGKSGGDSRHLPPPPVRDSRSRVSLGGFNCGAVDEILALAAPAEQGRADRKSNSRQVVKPDSRTAKGNSGSHTLEAVKAQLQALACERYEVGVLPPSDAKNGDLKPHRTREFDASTIEKAVPWLRRQNALGYEIYVRPAANADGSWPGLVFVDDLDAKKLSKMEADGHQFAALIESSPGNYHGWVRLPQERMTSDQVRAAAKLLAETYGGDHGAATSRRYGRLAGFTNRKQKHKRGGLHPFAMLRKTSRKTTDAARSLLVNARKLAEKWASEKRHADAIRLRVLKIEASRDTVPRDADSFFLRQAAELQHKCRKSDGSTDWSRVDYGAAGEMLQVGYSQREAADAIVRNSPAVVERKSDPAAYAQKTVEAAAADPRVVEGARFHAKSVGGRGMGRTSAPTPTIGPKPTTTWADGQTSKLLKGS